MYDLDLFRKNVRQEMYLQNLTLKELAYKTRIPYSTILSYVSKNSSVTPSVFAAAKIACTLGTTVEYLVTGDDSLLPKADRKINSIATEILNLPAVYRHSIENLIHGLANSIVE